MVYFSVLLIVKHAMIWYCDYYLYAAFDDLDKLKILLYKCTISFEIGSLRCVKYIEKKTNTVSAKFLAAATFSPKF